MTNWMNKLSVAACALLLAGSVACGNNAENNDSNNSECAAGEVNVGAGSSIAAGCYTSCTADATACSAEQECKTFGPAQKLCVAKTVVNPNNPNKCADGQVEATWKGDTKCYPDCSADANSCGTDLECKTSGDASICVPAEAPACGADEVETVVGGGTAQCYKKCTDDTACAADGKICKADDGGANMVCVEESQAAKLCKEAADLLLGDCLLNNCGMLTDEQKTQFAQFKENFIAGGGQLAPCEARISQDADELAFLQQLVAAGCDGTFTKLQQCYGLVEGGLATECGCETPTYDNGCTMDSECPATIASSCIQEDAATGEWPGGLCGYGACQVTNPMPNTVYNGEAAGCGPDTYCLVQDQDGQLASSCVSPCSQNSDCPRAVTGDADSGYVCSASLNFGMGQYVGQCIGACDSDAYCNQGAAPDALPLVCGDNRTCELACTEAESGQTCKVDDGMGGTRELAGTVCTATAKDPTKFGCKIAQPYTSPF